MELRVASALPLFAVDEGQTIVYWNRGAEQVTGIASAAAVGRPCWSVLAGRGDSGALICHRQCSAARHARAGRPLRSETMNIEAPDGRHRISVDAVSVLGNGSSLLLHLVADATAEPAAADERPVDEHHLAPRLTPRQLEVVRLLGEGSPARAIASTLGLAEATVRNHIRAVLLELGAHSQLEAVFLARGHELL